jgi:hypothetical protein
MEEKCQPRIHVASDRPLILLLVLVADDGLPIPVVGTKGAAIDEIVPLLWVRETTLTAVHHVGSSGS